MERLKAAIIPLTHIAVCRLKSADPGWVCFQTMGWVHVDFMCLSFPLNYWFPGSISLTVNSKSATRNYLAMQERFSPLLVCLLTSHCKARFHGQFMMRLRWLNCFLTTQSGLA